MRKLTRQEIKELQEKGCTATDWSLLHVVEDFDTGAFESVTFIGENYLSRLERKNNEGIYRAILSYCIIERGVYISDIAEGIHHYHIGEKCIIQNVQKIFYEPHTRCGEGAEVFPLDETGSRSVFLMDTLTAPLAYLLLFARQKEEFSQEFVKLSEKYINTQKPTSHSFIANQSVIKSCGELYNLHIKNRAEVTQVPRLFNVTLSGCRISTGAILEDAICLEGSVVEEYSILTRCFVGECSHIKGAFSAHDTLIFSNCQLANGEAVASVLGPHSVSAHRSTLLVGSLVSFFNAGSGTNQSNHHYQLGPIHYGVMERGCKTASNAYLLWPAHIGAYSLLSGRIVNRNNYLDFPFSHLYQDGKAVFLEPGVQLANIGLYRDVYKWRHRDQRKTLEKPQDLIDYQLLTPAVVYHLLRGYKLLVTTKEMHPEVEKYIVHSAYVSKGVMERGIRYYRTALLLYLVEHFSAWIEAKCENIYESSYFDLMGATISGKSLQGLLQRLASGQFSSIEEVHTFLQKHCNLHATHLYGEVLETLSPEGASHREKLCSLTEEMVQEIPKMLGEALRMAEKEAYPKKSVGFGLLASTEEETQNEIRLLGEPILQQPFVLEFTERIGQLRLKIEEIKVSL